MKKNILTIIIMAIVLINTILTGLLIFTIVPSTNRTNKLVSKVASIVDLELESPDTDTLSVMDIVKHEIDGELTINLKKGADGEANYALVSVTLSMNSKHKDYARLSKKVGDFESDIIEFVNLEFSNYTMDEVLNNKEKVKDEVKEKVLAKISDLFQSDFIINISFGNIVLS